MQQRSIAIPIEFREAFADVMTARGYQVIVVDREPKPFNSRSSYQRYLCGIRWRAVVITIRTRNHPPTYPDLTISFDYWLLLRSGRMPLNQTNLNEITAVILSAAYTMAPARNTEGAEDGDSMPTDDESH